METGVMQARIKRRQGLSLSAFSVDHVLGALVGLAQHEREQHHGY